MRTVHSRFCGFPALLLALLLAGWNSSAHGMVVDWDTRPWSNGSVNNSYDLNGDTVNDITIDITNRGNVFTNDPATGTMTPAVNQSITGGLSPVQNSLILAGNLKTQSDVTVHLSFTGTLPGAANVSFTIFDIDITTNADIIDTIYGVAYDGTHIAPTIVNVGPTVNHTGTGLNQVLTGNAASPNGGPGSANGNATITFGSTIITDIFFTFSNTAGAPRFQDIAIGDITFTPVPEINPAAVASLSCLAAVGLTVLLQRRARRARQAIR